MSETTVNTMHTHREFMEILTSAEAAERDCHTWEKLAKDNKTAYDVVLARAEVAEAELAALKEQMRWIPVGERLPEDGERQYLTLSPINEVFVMVWNRYWYSPFDENGDESVIFVTHWMPLPEPPEEE